MPACESGSPRPRIVLRDTGTAEHDSVMLATGHIASMLAAACTLFVGAGCRAGMDSSREEQRTFDASAGTTSRTGDRLQFDAVVLSLINDPSAGMDPATTSIRVLAPEEDCPEFHDDCGGNVAPVLGDPIFVVSDLSVPNLDDVRNGDSVAVLVPVEDPDCNLACGFNWSVVASSRTMGAGGGSLPANTPCSTTGSGVHVGIALQIPIFHGGDSEMRVENYQYRLGVTDRCGGRAEALEFAFSVEP
jgi:hypothetical protein